MRKTAWRWWWTFLFVWLALPLIGWVANVKTTRSCQERGGGLNGAGECVGALDGPEGLEREELRQAMVNEAEGKRGTSQQWGQASMVIIILHLLLGGWMIRARRKTTERHGE